MKRVTTMIDFNFNEDFVMLEHKDNEQLDENSYKVISKASDITAEQVQNVIQIMDENGDEVTCTYDKFLEIFDTQGLSGFIL